MTKQPPTRPRGEAMRRHILETALRLFSGAGYFNTSIHDIRREAGVSIGAIYHHFGNKELLARALYDDLLQRMDGDIQRAIASGEGTRAQCLAVIKKLFTLTEEQPATMSFILLAKHREFLSDHPSICSSQPFMAMRGVLERGMAQDEVRAMDPWVAATAMFGGALRMMNLALDGALESPLESYLQEVAECGWRAVKA